MYTVLHVDCPLLASHLLHIQPRVVGKVRSTQEVWSWLNCKSLRCYKPWASTESTRLEEGAGESQINDLWLNSSFG